MIRETDSCPIRAFRLCQPRGTGLSLQNAARRPVPHEALRLTGGRPNTRLSAGPPLNPRVYILPYHLYACTHLPARSLIKDFNGSAECTLPAPLVYILPYDVCAYARLAAALRINYFQGSAECTLGDGASREAPRRRAPSPVPPRPSARTFWRWADPRAAPPPRHISYETKAFAWGRARPRHFAPGPWHAWSLLGDKGPRIGHRIAPAGGAGALAHLGPTWRRTPWQKDWARPRRLTSGVGPTWILLRDEHLGVALRLAATGDVRGQAH